MDIEIAPCVTDADYEQWRQVRIAVLPYERTALVAELRAADSPERLMVLARVGGTVVGSGMAQPSDTANGGSVIPRVLPEHRRRGIGTALLHHLVAHHERLGIPTLRAGADDEGSLAFAERFGFREVNREVEQTFRLEGPVEATPVPDGVEVVTAQDRPGLWEASYERFGRECLADFAVDTPLKVSPQRWARDWLADPMFLAVHDGEVVGCAGLGLDPDDPTRAENGLTAVRRDWRGRGLAVHLKLVALAWAADHGVVEVYTWTQDGNAAMRALNTRLGYATTRVGLQLARPLRQDSTPVPTPTDARSVTEVRTPSRSTRVVPALAAAVVTVLLAGAPPGASAPAGHGDRTAGPQADRAVSSARLRVRTVVRRLQHPWDVQQAPGGRLVVTERDRARISVVRHGRRRTLADLSRLVWVSGETGLMSLAVDARTRTVWACHGSARGGRHVQVTRWRADPRWRRLGNRRTVLTGLPSTSGRHGGCRLLLDRSSDALLVGTGDAAVGTNPRDLDSLGGKVLRVHRRTGAPMADNPFAGATTARRFVLTYGHRNVQGLAQRGDGTLWSVEHGSYRDDEVNLLVPGGDYGWNPVPGYDESVPMTDQSLPGVQQEARWSSGDPTVATSGAAWVRGAQWGALEGTLAVAALKGSEMLFLRFDDEGALVSVRRPARLQRFGRLRSVTSARDGDLLVTTDNGLDDRVLRVSPR